jgi:hypothetical protein
MAKRIILPFLVITLLAGCGFTWKSNRRLSEDTTGTPPEILSFHADPVIRPGETWKIYLSVEDVDCDMIYVITDIRRSGASSYPVSFTPIRETACPRLAGYIFLKTPANQALMWDRFEAKVLVRDRRGNHSRSIKLPLNFDRIAPTEPPGKWQASTIVSIGAVQVDLVNSLETDSGR